MSCLQSILWCPLLDVNLYMLDMFAGGEYTPMKQEKFHCHKVKKVHIFRIVECLLENLINSKSKFESLQGN